MANTATNRILGNSDIGLAVGVVLILMVMIFPMPPAILDMLLALNLGIAILILMVSMYLLKPLQFSVFPGLLLIITLFRLSLNVASTRLILGEAYAGKIILAFGDFVVKGNYVVGLIIFLILVIINFVVITKGSGRVAEVAARFTLDSMPGKQMAIDADLNAGLIDEGEARRRREEITREADFYGSMDGASKFVRGDAIAGLIITLLNIVGGLIIGVAQMGMSMGDAVRTYTLLTVGDGLVSQIPALVISTAAGLVVTRTTSDASLGQDVFGQLLNNRRAVYIATGVLFALGILPGLPTIPFFVLATITGAVAYMMRETEEEAEEKQPAKKREETGPETLEDYLKVDPLELEIGYGLIPIVDQEQGGDLLNRISQIRKQCALEVGILIPPIRIRDNIQLKPNEYIMKIKGNEAARGELMLGRYLALNPGTAEKELEGVRVVEPAFGLPAIWVPAAKRDVAEAAGYTVVESVAVLTTHMLEVLKANAHQILGRQEVQDLIDNVKKEQPALVEGLVPGQLSLGSVEKVLQNLLRERVSVRSLSTILEVLADHANVIKDPDILTEYVRQSLGESIVQPYLTDNKVVRGITLDGKIEQAIATAVQEMHQSGDHFGMRQPVLAPDMLQGIFKALTNRVEGLVKAGYQPIVVTSPGIRLYFKKIVEAAFPNLIVLSYGEIPARVNIESIGSVRIENAS